MNRDLSWSKRIRPLFKVDELVLAQGKRTERVSRVEVYFMYQTEELNRREEASDKKYRGDAYNEDELKKLPRPKRHKAASRSRQSFVGSPFRAGALPRPR